jgi:bifunctional UDP-N-acetylglucosamine pyrophosphorylase/glucosamine-1-phosphate N-acetyltransferase
MAKTGDLALLILAAGEGTRMRSRRAKLLHPVCGRSMIRHVVATGRELGAGRIVVVVGQSEGEIRADLEGEAVEFVQQPQRLGTAHAALQADALLAAHPGPVIVTYGDMALYRAESYRRFTAALSELRADLIVGVTELPGETDFGRIVRGDDGSIQRIVEHVDATPQERRIQEVNLGVYVAQAEFLFPALKRISNHNAQGEFYLTDIVALALEEGRRVETAALDDWREGLGVNSRGDLAEVEKQMRRRIAEHWMQEGVTLEDPECTYIGADVEIGPDTVIAAGVSLRGKTRVGSDCRIDSGAVIEDSSLGDGVWIKPHCTIEQSELGDGCIVGPSAHFRPGVVLEEDVRVGNFVEVKNSRLGRGTKADHLSYIGDADVGERVTFACGAITVNYDGLKKSRTIVGDDAFVGCNANLIAPVEIKAKAFIAAGSTITSEVPEGALGVARGRQRNIEGWYERRFAKDD